MEVAIKTYYLDAALPADTAVHLVVDTRVAPPLRPRIAEG